MQYENNISSYQKKSLVSTKKQVAILFLLFGVAFLISRVIIFINANNIIGIAPFGISFLIAMAIKKNYKYLLTTFAGVTIGYFSFINNISGKYIIIFAAGFIVIYSLIAIKMNTNISEKIIFLIIVLNYFVYAMIINNYDIGVNITLSLINIAVVIPIYYIVKYGVKCISDFNNNYFFSVEDFFSMGIICCLVVAGIGNVSLYNISLRTVAAYFVIVAVACVGGTTYGSAIGMSMGIIVGISSGDLMMCTIFYGIIGLISGMFKQTGKIFVIISYIIMFFIISVYFQNLSIYSILEVLISALLILIVPNKIYKLIECEVDMYKKRDKINNNELDEVKKEFANKVKGLSTTLQIVSDSLDGMGDNDNLSYKNKSAAIIENLSQRVCFKCTRSKTCWERDFNTTYNSFAKLIKSCEENKIVFPHQLEKVCFEKFQLIKGADSLVTSLKSNEIFKNRLQEGRLIASKHLSLVSDTVNEMIQNFKRDIKIDSDLERILVKALNKKSVYPKKVFCYIDENARIKIKLDFINCEGSNYCPKVILPLISEIMNKRMEICDEGCKIKYETGECSSVITEAPKYAAISYAAGIAKSAEKYSGDTYSFEKCRNGKYINIISDGMGFGPKASKDSLITVKMVEKYMESGFSEECAINMINNVMSMRFDEDESFSTLDFNVIDLYSGKANFIKVGAATSFIKRGKKVKVVSSNMPPFGTVDKLDLESINVNLKSGDLIVMISDGIVDINKNKMLDYCWVEEFLSDSVKEPKKLAQDILDKAKELAGDNIIDDMTVLVCKIRSEVVNL